MFYQLHCVVIKLIIFYIFCNKIYALSNIFPQTKTDNIALNSKMKHLRSRIV